MDRSQIPNLDKLTEAVKDNLTVRRVFGEPIESGGALVIPVVKIAGGSGIGFGGGEVEESGVGFGGETEESGVGFGGGEMEDNAGSGETPGSGEGGAGSFVVRAKPAGVYRVRDGEVEWRPALDVNRLALGGQVLMAVVAIAWAVSRRRRDG